MIHYVNWLDYYTNLLRLLPEVTLILHDSKFGKEKLSKFTVKGIPTTLSSVSSNT